MDNLCVHAEMGCLTDVLGGQAVETTLEADILGEMDLSRPFGSN